MLRAGPIKFTSISFLEKLFRKASGRFASVIAYGPLLQVPVGTFKVINALKKLNKVTLFVTCGGITA